jgi:hypothetical protein
MKQYNIQLRYSYNMDEKSFIICVTGRSEQVFTQRQREKKDHSKMALVSGKLS